MLLGTSAPAECPLTDRLLFFIFYSQWTTGCDGWPVLYSTTRAAEAKTSFFVRLFSKDRTTSILGWREYLDTFTRTLSYVHFCNGALWLKKSDFLIKFWSTTNQIICGVYHIAFLKAEVKLFKKIRLYTIFSVPPASKSK
jgi:hypothetical protein